MEYILYFLILLPLNFWWLGTSISLYKFHFKAVKLINGKSGPILMVSDVGKIPVFMIGSTLVTAMKNGITIFLNTEYLLSPKLTRNSVSSN